MQLRHRDFGSDESYSMDQFIESIGKASLYSVETVRFGLQNAGQIYRIWYWL